MRSASRRLAPRGRLRPHTHEGVEFIYVIHGAVTIALDGGEQTLRAGDAIYFDATIPHSYSRSGSRPCTAIVVTAA